MELRTLQYFLTAAREENITRAAAMLHVSQPSLSRQLMQLEEELGVKLFTRGSHSITLTEDGLLLRRRAEELLSLAEKTRQELRRQEEISGLISIGSGEYQSSSFLTDIMAEFRRLHPLVEYDFYSGNSDNIKERIERGILDFGLLLEPVEMAKYDFLRLPGAESWGALVSEGSTLADREALTPEDLAGLPLMSGSRELIKGELLAWFGELKDSVVYTAGGNLPYNLAMLAKSSGAVFINLKLNCEYSGLRFVPLSPPLERRTVLVWKKAQPYSHAAEAFLEYAKKYIKRISDDTI